jgi:LPS-assembly lipoprotein
MARRRSLAALATVALLALGGCGWTPLYADRETGPADEALRAIRVAPIPERIGQRLEIGLREAFNPGGEPTPQRYVLNTTLAVSRASLGIQSQGLGTRGETNVTASYRLTEIKTGKVVQTSTMHVAESFDIQANNYSTIVAQRDADARLADELREEIVARLTLFLQRQAKQQTAARPSAVK